jgi:hypothetical protein
MAMAGAPSHDRVGQPCRSPRPDGAGGRVVERRGRPKREHVQHLQQVQYRICPWGSLAACSCQASLPAATSPISVQNGRASRVRVVAEGSLIAATETFGVSNQTPKVLHPVSLL